MTVPSSAKSAKNKLWTYTVTRARKTNVVKSEALISPFGKQISCTYTHGPTHESLSFQGTDDRNYEWRSSSHLSTVNGSRYDVLRHALFLVTSNNGPEIIVADHTHWDGFLTMVSCPDEALYIRSQGVDATMIVATLQVLKDWEMESCREERRKDPVGVEMTAADARMRDLGRVAYWRESDFNSYTGAEVGQSLGSSVG
ncbi:hypothetical protein K432DRAFT_293585 [Lepidopterella palustris CBS 459.81]|uniref:Uncharacterized protein n=1 Tax=Lepidopterella palustris CBS 459.81 TaxID=1314670 RepID=A0A8E2EEH5_9PEZI|nr:hypothetical protein K432DRAFT_293585 [Lepidopterella palustris CBS 459.81]